MVKFYGKKDAYLGANVDANVDIICLSVFVFSIMCQRTSKFKDCGVNFRGKSLNTSVRGSMPV